MEYTHVSCNLCGSTNSRMIAQGLDFEYRTVNDSFTFVQCKDCNLVYLNPRPASTELGVIYPPDYGPYHFDEVLPPLINKIRMAVQRQKVTALKRYAHPAAVIWDVGCGGGFFLECMRAIGSPEWKLAGVDVSQAAIDKIRDKGFAGYAGRFEELTVEHGAVDVIVLNQVIEHLEDPAGVVKKAGELLRHGGFLFIETPSVEGWDARIFRARYWGGWHFPRHWTLFTQHTLGKLLEAEGFVVVDRNWLLSPTFWTQSVHHYLVDKGVPETVARFFDIKNPFVLAFFCCVELMQMAFGHTSNMRIVARKK